METLENLAAIFMVVFILINIYGVIRLEMLAKQGK